ncbi:MAG: hypothetical protein KDB23_24145, partial [Planctomycetales bacterium]|nr:hypothetical protein [Planctomycetales bacterium]
MPIRQSSPRVDRRRRVLVDDRYATTSGRQLNVVRDESRPARRYSLAADVDRQSRFCDIIPRRPWTRIVWMLTLATTQAGLALLHSSYHLHAAASPIDLAPLNYGSPGGLLTTATGFALLAAGCYSMLVLLFRRHKLDDYRGKYRIWYSVTTGLLASGLLLLSGMGPVARSALQYLVSLSTTGHAELAALLIGASLGAYYLGRLLLEVRHSRPATVWAALSGMLAIISTISWLNWLPFPSHELQQLAAGNSQLAACHCLLVAILFYAGHVTSDVMGELEVDANDEDEKSSSTAPEKNREVV